MVWQQQLRCWICAAVPQSQRLALYHVLVRLPDACKVRDGDQDPRANEARREDVHLRPVGVVDKLRANVRPVKGDVQHPGASQTRPKKLRSGVAAEPTEESERREEGEDILRCEDERHVEGDRMERTSGRNCQQKSARMPYQKILICFLDVFELSVRDPRMALNTAACCRATEG